MEDIGISNGLVYVIVSSAVVSLLSLVGIFFFFFKSRQKAVTYWVSFAAGVMLATVFFHLLPEVKNIEYAYFFIIAGIIFYFLLEKFMRWVHCHKRVTKEHIHPVGMMNILGDSIHNFLDGIAIGASYLIDIYTGALTTLVIILHEIPQEIGDFGMLIYAGYEKKKALIWNFVSALFAVIGSLIGYFYGSITLFPLISFVIGGFLYISMSDIVPELHKSNTFKESFLQSLFLLMGIALIVLIEYSLHAIDIVA